VLGVAEALRHDVLLGGKATVCAPAEQAPAAAPIFSATLGGLAAQDDGGLLGLRQPSRFLAALCSESRGLAHEHRMGDERDDAQGMEVSMVVTLTHALSLERWRRMNAAPPALAAAA
jgi:hypothetical protein